MQYRPLGATGLTVSELCFGVLPMGPLQADISAETGGHLLLSAMESGVTFFDTAQMYQTYDHLRWALDRFDGPVVITSKSVAKDYASMEQAVQEALEKLGRDHIDIFLLHAARDAGNSLELRREAWQCLLEQKRRGYVRAVGVSTHSAASVSVLAEEPEVDVLFPLVNQAGLGVIGGTLDDMLAAVAKAAAAGKGLYSMKALGGGVLLPKLREALAFNRGISAFSAHAVGMVRPGELALNLSFFNDEPVEDSRLADVRTSKQWSLMEVACKGCGHCVEMCHSSALTMGSRYPQVDLSKCLLCGYCAADCPQFAIRVI